MVNYICTLCARTAPRSKHHLIPRSQLRVKQKDFEPESLTGLCTDCHRKVHASFSNKDLAKLYNTIEKLREAPGMPEWTRFVSKKSGTERITTISSKNR